MKQACLNRNMLVLSCCLTDDSGVYFIAERVQLGRGGVNSQPSYPPSLF